MNLLTPQELRDFFHGKNVVVCGSAPTIVENEPGFIDSFDVVVRCNVYKIIMPNTGRRVDVFYSYFGNAITKTSDELKADGVKICISKVPNSQPIECAWHRRMGKMTGIDFRWIYRMREERKFWFCPVYVPTDAEFLEPFNVLGGHIPTTGFGAIWTAWKQEPKRLHITGFDFFTSGIHNVNEKWKPGRPDDPIKHVPEKERAWLSEAVKHYPITVDRFIAAMLKKAA